MNDRLIAYRKLIKLNQSEMARKLNISLTSYNRKEKGKRSFTQQEMLEITKLIKEYVPDITMDDIFFDSYISKLLNMHTAN
ncbi:helix-turn-helix domain-containing protein [Clostridium sp. SYSU_GA19001]|uniref:helix-turn-helix transcriptional regulator n=1 Tax=Clostridium caldaquaticum TaxID=2940653 RepID=UPI00207771F7|nr:helix-turn-helix transcriptional regulator [Clostridium caldaquaticum]MCM8710493.1 helix-turn-helix domain-containing protein [Clostridium caldaquaticum]